jgi:orotate phosphoribosyltransferase
MCYSMLSHDEVIALLKEAGTLKDGHFVLTSGRHSDRFFLMPYTFMHPDLTEQLCADLAARFDGIDIETVVGPATGGIVLAYEVARQLGLRRGGRPPRAIFTEKTEDGKMALKRQWTLSPGEQVLVVEDAVTTGGSIQKALDAIARFEPAIVGIGCIADRSNGAVDFGTPLRSLVKVQVESWLPADCPLCRQGIAIVKPKA